MKKLISLVLAAAMALSLVGCGSGNNGGDGFAVARLLKEKGCDVEAAFIGNEESRSPDCMQQMKIAENCGVPVVTTISRKEYTVIVDAVFGVGLNREVSGAYAANIKKMNALPGQKVAIDIPSGICSATGKVLGTAFSAVRKAGLCFTSRLPICRKNCCRIHRNQPEAF